MYIAYFFHLLISFLCLYKDKMYFLERNLILGKGGGVYITIGGSKFFYFCLEKINIYKNIYGNSMKSLKDTKMKHD